MSSYLLLTGDSFHLEAAMAANPTLRALRYDPYSKLLTDENYETQKMKSILQKDDPSSDWDVSHLFWNDICAVFVVSSQVHLVPKSAANTINQRDFINHQLQKCEKVTKPKINFYNIDFWQRHDLLSVTQEIININRGNRPKSSKSFVVRAIALGNRWRNLILLSPAVANFIMWRIK